MIRRKVGAGATSIRSGSICPTVRHRNSARFRATFEAANHGGRERLELRNTRMSVSGPTCYVPLCVRGGSGRAAHDLAAAVLPRVQRGSDPEDLTLRKCVALFPAERT